MKWKKTSKGRYDAVDIPSNLRLFIEYYPNWPGNKWGITLEKSNGQELRSPVENNDHSLKRAKSTAEFILNDWLGESVQMTHKKLIEQSLAGTSAKHLVDSLVEELPPLPALITYIKRELPKESVVKIEENTVFISKVNKQRVSEKIHFLSLAYPELEFVVE